MSFNTIFFIILFIYFWILLIYFLHSRNLNVKFINRRIKLIPKKNENLTRNKRSRIKEIDILDNMSFLMASLNEDSQKNNNTILFDYNIGYPRIFNVDASVAIKLTDALAQIMLQNLSNATIIIKFLLSNYRNKHIKFTISVWSDKSFCEYPRRQDMAYIDMNKNSRKFLNLAKEIAEQNGSSVRFEYDAQGTLRVSADIMMELSDIKKDILKNLKIKDTKNFKALIAQSNRYAFNILKDELEFIGIDVKPSSDFDIIKRHIKDTIFKPQIVFIESKILENFNIKELEYSFINKKISLVVVQSEIGAIAAINPQIYTQYLPQPYTPDILVNIINNAYDYNIGGGRTP